MRICLASASRQPCSAGSCIAVTKNLLSVLKTTPRCEPAHSRNSGFAAMSDALAIRCRAQDAAAMDGDRRHLARAADQENAFLSPDESRVVAEKMHRCDRHADLELAHPVGDRNDGSRVIARIELFHHV